MSNLVRSSSAFKRRLYRDGVQHRQAGMSSIGLLAALAAGSFVLVCILKMLPVYIENRNLQSILESVQKDHIEGKKPLNKAQIRSRIDKRFNINQIDSVTMDGISIEKANDAYTVSANYEVRVPLFANIDVVMKFDKNQVELPLSER